MDGEKFIITFLKDYLVWYFSCKSVRLILNAWVSRECHEFATQCTWLRASVLLMLPDVGASDRLKICIFLTDLPVTGHGRSRENLPIPVTGQLIGLINWLYYTYLLYYTYCTLLFFIILAYINVLYLTILKYTDCTLLNLSTLPYFTIPISRDLLSPRENRFRWNENFRLYFV